MNRLYNIKLKAGALQYTIFISVIIALLLFSFISLTYVQQKLSVKNKQFQELIEVVDEAFLSSNLEGLSYNTPTELTSINGNKNEFSVIKYPWGMYDVISLTGTRNKEVFTKTALSAGHQPKRPALYLQDDNQPLVLVGNTKIEGNVYLPKQGVKRGTIAGNSYANTQLVYGSISTSSKSIPTLINLQALKKIKNQVLSTDMNEFEVLEEGMSLVNSFSNPTKIVGGTSTIDLHGVRLTGNIIVHTNHKIKVSKSSELRDVLLIAPEIEIEELVKGSFQAIATKKITVAENCNLKYPTSLVLLEKQSKTTTDNKESPQISIAKGSVVKGIVAYVSSNSKENYDTHIRIEEDTTITGEVYCTKNIELQGAVNGSIYTRGFIANQFGSVYKNHIYNGKIVANQLPSQYTGLQFKNSNYKTAKWVYY